MLLAVPVLAAHLAALRSVPLRGNAAPPRPLQFATRSVLPPLPSAPIGAPAPPRAAAPAARTGPAPRVRGAPAAQRAAVRVPAASPRGARHAPAPAPAPATAPASEPAPLLALPAPARLHYELTLHKGGVTLAGRALLEWRHDGHQYEARLETASVGGPRVQRSTGRITADGLVPGYFSDRGRSEQATHFDRANGRLVFSNNRPEAPLAAGMQDRLSVILQVAALLAGQPARYPSGSRIAIPTATTREAASWVFSVEAEEDLDLPGGVVRALRLERLPRHEYDQKVELWLAPGLDYAPVRLRLTNPNGDTADQRWSATDKG